MPEDFELEQDEEKEPRFRDRNRGRSQYMRRAIVKIFRMSPTERATYKPINGFEEAAIAHFERCTTAKTGNAAMTFVLTALGENVSKNDPKEKPGDFQVVDDLPRASHAAKAN